MRRIANQRKARLNVAEAVQKLDRENGRFANEGQVPKVIAEPLAQFGHEGGRVELNDSIGLAFWSRPNNAAESVGEGQNGEGSIRLEALVGHLLVRNFGFDKRDDARLPVLPADRANLSGGAERRV